MPALLERIALVRLSELASGQVAAHVVYKVVRLNAPGNIDGDDR